MTPHNDMGLDRRGEWVYAFGNPQHGDRKTAMFACGLAQTEYLRTNAPSVSPSCFRAGIKRTQRALSY